ncbi:MAG: acyl carrier protein [Olsenella sp.]|nr:acyl carrier protein [Olsenella sp.]
MCWAFLEVTMDDDLTLDHMIELLEDVKGNVDYENCTTLVDDRVLDSFDILSIISSINDELDVSVPAKDIVPDNFNSAQAMLEMVKRLVDEEG